MRHTASLLATIVLTASGDPAFAASFRVYRPPGHVPAIIILEGQIATTDGLHFANLLTDLRREHRPAGLVTLNSPGGDVGEALVITEMVRQNRLDTYVPRLCASSCFNVFAAGEKRMASREASIGVHSAFTGEGPNAQGTAAMADYAIWCGTPHRIISKLLATPAPRMSWLKTADMRAMGVKLTP